MKRDYHIIGACSCWGAQVCACESGPEELAKGFVFERLRGKGMVLDEVEMLYPKIQKMAGRIPLNRALLPIRDFNLQVTHAVRKAEKNGQFPIVVGGDHSIAVGTWNAFKPPFGLIWIDAHMDAHTPETTPSGAYHGMPIATLLGYGSPELVHLTKKNPILRPENLALIGVHSFEEEEAALLKKLNVRVYLLNEVEKRGLKTVFTEAIAHVTRGVSHYGVSLDLDAFALEDAPGVDSPVEAGIPKKELLPLISQFGEDERLIGFEIVEFNPERDIEHKTRELVFEVLSEFMQ